MSRRGILILKLVSLVVLLLLVCAISWRIVTKGWSSMAFQFGSDSLIAEQTYDPATAVEVDVQNYAVEVQTHTEDTIKVEIYNSGYNTTPDPVPSRNGGTVMVKQSGSFGFNLGGGKVLIYVPESSVMDYSLKTVSGSVKLFAASNTATLKSVSGSIQAGQGGQSVSASTVSGSIKIFAPFTTVDCESTSGSVRARANQETTRVSLASVSGSAKLSLDGVSGYRMTHRSVSGSVKDLYNGLDFAKSGSNSWGDESLEISIHTTSGSIKLLDWVD